MNALFLTFSSFSPVTGVGKKIYAQMEAIMNNGFDKVFYGNIRDGINFSIGKESYGPMESISKPIKRFYHLSNIIDFVINNDVKFIYYRFSYPSEPATILLFHKLKKIGIKMVMEIPTYPYTGEIKDHDRFYYLDILTRRALARQFSYIITFSDKRKIFGKESINISNGVNFNDLPLKKKIDHVNFNLLGVANLAYWHGFDRIIRGLYNYYKIHPEVNVCFHIVSGSENDDVRKLKILTKELHLENCVYFHGEVNGKRLDQLFDNCDLAIGSLGRHRNNITSLKTLKNVEYAARGVPFIYSENNDDFDDKKFIYKIPANDSPIDIPDLISFKNSCTYSPSEIRNTILHMSWDKQINKIIIKLQF